MQNKFTNSQQNLFIEHLICSLHVCKFLTVVYFENFEKYWKILDLKVCEMCHFCRSLIQFVIYSIHIYSVYQAINLFYGKEITLVCNGNVNPFIFI